MTNLIGPDISFYQDAPGTPQGVDFVKMRTQTPFVVIRAGQNTWIDSDFHANWQAAGDAGLHRGSYWFYDSRTKPQTQVDLWRSVFGNELPFFLGMDFEESYHGAYASETHMRDFAEGVMQEFPSSVEIGVYTGPAWWVERVPAYRRGWWLQFPLWIANYDVVTPTIPPPWSNWLFWQFTDRGDGAAYGVESSRIDLNYFDGDVDGFHSYFELDELNPIPQPPTNGENTMTDSWKVIWDDGANRRPAPNLNNSPIPPPLADNAVFGVVEYFIPPGKTIEQEYWGKLEDGKWVALTHNSLVRAVPQFAPPVDPPPASDEYITHVKDGVSRKFIPE